MRVFYTHLFLFILQKEHFMSIKKVTLASLILLGLTACSSGGSGSSSNNVAKPNTKPQTTQQQTDKAAAEKAAKDKAAKEKAEAERLAAEKAAKEKAEAERLAAEKEVDPIAIIKAKGIDDTNYGLKLGNSKETIEGKVTVRTQSYLYNQPYSVVTAQAVQRNGWENGNYIDKVDGTVTVKGLKTEKLPTEGTATYSGKAFNHDGAKGFNGGDLTYNVNFSKRTGSGRVEGEFGNLIVLEEGTINNTQISSTVHGNNPLNLSGKYTVEFFGKNAEEIAGEIQTKANLTGEVSNFGLAGTRGDIQK